MHAGGQLPLSRIASLQVTSLLVQLFRQIENQLPLVFAAAGAQAGLAQRLQGRRGLLREPGAAALVTPKESGNMLLVRRGQRVPHLDLLQQSKVEKGKIPKRFDPSFVLERTQPLVVVACGESGVGREHQPYRVILHRTSGAVVFKGWRRSGCACGFSAGIAQGTWPTWGLHMDTRPRAALLYTHARSAQCAAVPAAPGCANAMARVQGLPNTRRGGVDPNPWCL